MRPRSAAMNLHPSKVTLAHGAHRSPQEGVCVMELVCLLSGQEQFITRVAQRVNDVVSDSERQRLKALIPRLLRARRTDKDRRINLRLAVHSAKSVLHLVTPENMEKAVKAIATAEAWLAGEASLEECRAAYADAYAAAYAYAAADTAAAYDPVLALSDLLDAWEKAVVEEGLEPWVPTPWEDAALEWAAEYAEAVS